jgi:hypothetical protein
MRLREPETKFLLLEKNTYRVHHGNVLRTRFLISRAFEAIKQRQSCNMMHRQRRVIDVGGRGGWRTYYGNTKLTAIRALRPAKNKGRIVGQKRPLKPKYVWAIRVRLELAENHRDLALFNLAIDGKLCGCDW